jgi:hypothetical protein
MEKISSLSGSLSVNNPILFYFYKDNTFLTNKKTPHNNWWGYSFYIL